MHAHDNDHMTAMDYAVDTGHDSVAELLSERGAGLEGEFLRDRLVTAVNEGAVKALQRYMWFAKDMSVAVQFQDGDGRSLVHIAANCKRRECRAELLELLVSFGADINEVDFFGNDALSRAAALDPGVTSFLRTASISGVELPPAEEAEEAR
jgi:ankyrin repeat protein